MADAFYNNFIVNFGIPTRIHSDQGENFESNIIKQLCAFHNIKKSHTSIYHPQGNGITGRINRTLLGVMGTLENSQKDNWKNYLNSLVYAYNCTPHETTKISPFELMFGRKSKLPIDAVFQSLEETNYKTTKEYAEDMKERITRTQAIVHKYTEKASEKQTEDVF